MMILWPTTRSPLILGANLTKLDSWTSGLLTNPEVLAMDQHSHNQKQAMHDSDLIAWTSDGKPGEHYLVLFNLGDEELIVHRSLDAFGLQQQRFKIHNAWTGSPVEMERGPNSRSLVETLPAHGCVMLELQER